MQWVTCHGAGQAALDLHLRLYGTDTPGGRAAEGGNSFCFRTDNTLTQYKTQRVQKYSVKSPHPCSLNTTGSLTQKQPILPVSFFKKLYILSETHPEKVQPLLRVIYTPILPTHHCSPYNENSLHDKDVTWQSRRVDWNAHV